MLTADVAVHYDPVIHITAGELRKIGFLIPEVVSDAAFVRRVAIGLDGNEPLNRNTCTLRLQAFECFMEPQPYLGVDFLEEPVLI